MSSDILYGKYAQDRYWKNSAKDGRGRYVKAGEAKGEVVIDLRARVHILLFDKCIVIYSDFV